MSVSGRCTTDDLALQRPLSIESKTFLCAGCDTRLVWCGADICLRGAPLSLGTDLKATSAAATAFHFPPPKSHSDTGSV